MRALRPIAAVALGAALLSPAVEAKTKLASGWLDREIVVDGELDEWRDALQFVKSVDAFVGLFNDDESLYLCLYSQDQRMAQKFVEDGIRALFESADGEFVVLYPPGEGKALQLRLPGRRDDVTVAATGEAGIEAAASHRGSFVYELKLPLAAGKGRAWAPGLDPGERFKLVLANPQIDRLAEERAARENRHGGGSASPSPMDPRSGGRSDPTWSGGRVDRNDVYFVDEHVFLLKVRVELAEAP